MTSKDLQALKYNRLSEPEKIILESFKGLKAYIHNNFLDWVYYKSEQGIFYAYNERYGWLEYDIDLIYLKIESYFDGSFMNTDYFVRTLVEKHIKIKAVTTTAFISARIHGMEKHLKLKT